MTGARDDAASTVFLLTGAGGQVGHELVRELSPLGRVLAPLRNELDLASEDSIIEAVRAARPTFIVNAAAYTAVDKAESEPDLARAINSEAPGILAEEARRVGASLIHYSTDYVFDGASSRPYVENDATAPLNVYGETKRGGERAIEAVGGAWAVLRTSWVYGPRGNNFLRTMLRLAREREELRVVDDQIGAPTWSRAIARGTADLIARLLNAEQSLVDRSGVYHMTGSGQTTWRRFADSILSSDPRRDEQKCTRVVPIATSDYPTPAARPKYSVLDSSKLAATFGVSLPPWDEQLRAVMREV